MLSRVSRPPDGLIDRVQAATGRRVSYVRPGSGSSDAATERWIVEFEGGATGFAKMATDEPSAQQLRAEHQAYEEIGLRFMAEPLGWWDTGGRPVLVLEDLSDADWPPPWDGHRVLRLHEALGRVHRVPAPDWAPDAEHMREDLDGWRAVADDPRPFLSLGLAGASWLEVALPVLRDAALGAALGGETLLHGDVRSGNVCFESDGRAVFVDWTHLARGNPLVDFAFWLPGLHAEGGPAPWELLDDSEGFSALVSGYFAAQAGLPPPSPLSNLRDRQLQQLRVALPWAVRELGLPQPTAW